MRGVQGTATAGLALVVLATGVGHHSERTAGGVALAAPPAAISADELCGTRPNGVREALRLHAAWTTAETALLPTTASFDTLGIAVLEDDGTILRPAGGQVRLDPVAATRAFYRTHDDDYDFVCFYAASSIPYAVIPNTSAFAYEVNVVQDVQGLGLGLWDYTKDFGSGGRLRSITNMNRLAAYPADPFQNMLVTNNTMDVLAHEAGHRWLAYVANDSAGTATDSFLGAGFAHWNFYYDSDAALLGGNDWADNGDGTWTSVEATARYGPLELYLMGYLPPDSVGAQTVLYDATACLPPANYTKQHHPLDGVTCEVRPEAFTLADIVDANGPRVPDAAASPKTHRFAFVLVLANGTAPSALDLAKLGAIRAAWPAYFAAATGNRGTADVTLLSRDPEVVVRHGGHADSEDAGGSYAIQAEVELAHGSRRAAVTAATLEYGVNGGGLLPLAMTEATPGVYEAAIPGQALGSEVRYRIHVETDVGAEGWWPDVAATHVFHVATDVEPPVVAVASRVETIGPGYSSGPEWMHGVHAYRLYLVAQDNLGVAEVWARYNVLPIVGEPLGGLVPAAHRVRAEGEAAAAVFSDSALCTRLGVSDTFYVDLPTSPTNPSVVDYSLRAVDASSAGNQAVAAECAGICSGSIGPVWREPLDASDGGFLAAAVTGGAVDQWHWTDADDHTGRAAWKCGDADDLNYLTGLDAGLTTPPIPLTSESVLRFHHRYDTELETPGVAYDGGRVEISVGGGAWTPLTPAGGYPSQLADDGVLPAGTPVYGERSAGWESGDFVEAEFPLTGLDSATVRFRLRFVSDGFVGGGGWFVDDLAVEPSGNTGASPTEVAGRGLRVQPNPARETVRFSAQLGAEAWVSLEIFDAAGRRVARPYAGAASGSWSHAWSPRQAGAGVLPPGVYWARLSGSAAGEPLPPLVERFVWVR